MLIDLNDSTSPRRADCDICIVGAGAAGITLTMQLVDSGVDVVVLESGGLAPDPSVQALNAGKSSGATRQPLDSTRLRYFGGTTNHWTGLIAPLSAQDFDRESAGEVPGWPVSSEQMAGFYRRALHFIRHPDGQFDESLSDVLDRCRFPFDVDRISQSFLHYSTAIQFGDTFLQSLVDASNIRVILNATATDLRRNGTGKSVQRIRASNLASATIEVTARVFVLACGAIENARILLHAKRTALAGDPHGLLGRFLMDHPTGICGEVVSTGRYPLGELFPDFIVADRKFRPVLSLPTQVLSGRELTNASCYLWAGKPPSGGRAFLAQALEDLRGSPESRNRQIEQLARDIDRLAVEPDDNCIRNSSNKRVRLHIKAVLEQAPRYNNRIVLSDETDALGVPLPHVQWRLGEQEHRSLMLLLTNLGTELGRLAAGRVRLFDWLLGDALSLNENMLDYNHAMGCTRMARTEREGVVDEHARVFGTDNLFVAGASVFSTSGIYNPTLTIVALTIRLADHLKTHFAH